jgi:hypothetical protein
MKINKIHKVSFRKQRSLKLDPIIVFVAFQILFSIHTFGQSPNDSVLTRHIFFTQPVGLLFRDYSLGYELKKGGRVSYTIIVDFFKPWINNYKISDTPSELEMYKGISIRPGIKIIKKSGFYNSYSGYYKLSGYENKLILRKNSEGEYADVFYRESRTCHSAGIEYKFGYEIFRNHIFFSPFLSAGLRVRFDDIKIDGKYNYQGGIISSENEPDSKVWLLPIFRIGCLFGFGI